MDSQGKELTTGELMKIEQERAVEAEDSRQKILGRLVGGGSGFIWLRIGTGSRLS
jgi:hypothetical protein